MDSVGVCVRGERGRGVGGEGGREGERKILILIKEEIMNLRDSEGHLEGLRGTWSRDRNNVNTVLLYKILVGKISK